MAIDDVNFQNCGLTERVQGHVTLSMDRVATRSTLSTMTLTGCSNKVPLLVCILAQLTIIHTVRRTGTSLS